VIARLLSSSWLTLRYLWTGLTLVVVIGLGLVAAYQLLRFFVWIVRQAGTNV
jgi:hypothetical protein